jgi:hypothetical protein
MTAIASLIPLADDGDATRRLAIALADVPLVLR